jgi:hypothetical protein
MPVKRKQPTRAEFKPRIMGICSRCQRNHALGECVMDMYSSAPLPEPIRRLRISPEVWRSGGLMGKLDVIYDEIMNLRDDIAALAARRGGR